MTKTTQKPTKKGNKKKKAGQPTKYNHTMQMRADKYIEECIQSGTTPFLERLAVVILRVNGDTIVEWAKKHEEFSATIKAIEEYQKLRIQEDGLTNKNNVSMAIFLLKANHGLRDVTTIANDPDNPINTQNVVMYLPDNERSKPTGQ